MTLNIQQSQVSSGIISDSNNFRLLTKEVWEKGAVLGFELSTAGILHLEAFFVLGIFDTQ
jgi:hypothetical protein